jgi:hypothetical protein
MNSFLLLRTRVLTKLHFQELKSFAIFYFTLSSLCASFVLLETLRNVDASMLRVEKSHKKAAKIKGLHEERASKKYGKCVPRLLRAQWITGAKNFSFYQKK